MKVETEYLMTLYAPLHPPQVADDRYFIYDVKPGGWVKGPKINGELIGPSGDWGRAMADGTFVLDVRGSIKADDGSVIFLKYTGRIVMSKEVNERFMKGEELSGDEAYFVTSPTFETVSKKYGWLNQVVAVGKMAGLKAGPESFVKYDIFAVK